MSFSAEQPGISFGYSFELSNILVICTNIIIETILVLIFYPLFVFSWSSILVIKPLRRIMKRTNIAAEAHQDTIRKYGVIGLFMFVWIPFWMTGPMVGCAVGYLLGFSPWKNLTIVLSGTYLAIICWALLLRKIHDRGCGIWSLCFHYHCYNNYTFCIRNLFLAVLAK